MMAEDYDNSGGGCVVLADTAQNMLARTRGLLESMFSAIVMVAEKASMYRAIDRIEPDMLVIDLSLHMPEGDTIIRGLKPRYPELKFIVLSLHDDPITLGRSRHSQLYLH
jgi:DNA-binding NarL/FixJ family response regulator